MVDSSMKAEALKVELGKEARRLKLDFNQLKSGGLIKQTQKDLFTIRLRCPGGMLNSQKLRKAAELADKYGKGEVHLSVRQSVEIPYVHYHHFNEIAQELAEIGWSLASCGPRVRVPAGCAGCTYNPNGLADTMDMIREVDQRFFGTPTGHHKFKITFSGCPIDCPRSREMDLGFQGMMEPKLLAEKCSGCELCVKACDDQALTMVNGLPQRDLSKCISCGECVKLCPVDAMVSARTGWLVRAGGKHGKHPVYGYEVAQFVNKEQALKLIEKTLEWYKANGQGRERIGNAIIRLGLDTFMREVVEPIGVEALTTPQQRKKFWAEGNFYE